MKKAVAYISFIIFLQSCIKEVPLVSTEFVEPKPVFYLFLNPDSNVTANYAKATSITNPNVFVDNALISVFKNNILQGDMTSLSGGKYALGANSFKPRDSFRIYASDGLYSFFVRGKVPSNLSINAIDTQTMLIAGLGPAFTLDLTFTDSAVDDNFYRLSLKKTWYRYKLNSSLQRIDSQLMTSFIDIKSSELPFIQNNYNNYSSQELLFSDATFNGTKSKFRLYTPSQIHSTLSSRTLSVELILENLEKPLYDYYNTRNAHLWQQQSITQIPGVVQGNIGVGYGVAAAYTSVSKVIIIK